MENSQTKMLHFDYKLSHVYFIRVHRPPPPQAATDFWFSPGITNRWQCYLFFQSRFYFCRLLFLQVEVILILTFSGCFLPFPDYFPPFLDYKLLIRFVVWCTYLSQAVSSFQVSSCISKIPAVIFKDASSSQNQFPGQQAISSPQ